MKRMTRLLAALLALLLLTPVFALAEEAPAPVAAEDVVSEAAEADVDECTVDLEEEDGTLPFEEEVEEVEEELDGAAANDADMAEANASGYTPQSYSLDVHKNTKYTLKTGDTLRIYLMNGLTANAWSSNKVEIATVNDDGLVQAWKPGTANITARLTTGKKITVKVTVKDPYLPTRVSFNASGPATLYVGLEGTLQTSVEPYYAETTYTFTSSNKKVVKVLDKSKGTIRCLKPGTAKITVKTKNKKKATLTIKVKANKLTISSRPTLNDISAGSLRISVKSVERKNNGDYVCEFYLINRAIRYVKHFNSVSVTLSIAGNHVAGKTFSKVTVNSRKNSVKTFKVTFSGDSVSNRAFVLLPGMSVENIGISLNTPSFYGRKLIS